MTREQVLGAWARAPSRLMGTPRRRRLLLLAVSAPGVLVAVLGTQVRQEPAWLAVGAVLVVLALLARGHSEPRFLAWEAFVAAAPRSDKEPSHAS